MTNTPKVERPDLVEEVHLRFLDEVRASGVINMFGAAPVLLEAFPSLGRANARTVHTFWMRSFGERHPRTDGSSR